MPDAQQQKPPEKRRGRGKGKNNSRRCDPQQVERARNWADWYGMNRLMRGIHPNGIAPEELREQ
jgi:hypothetical protein